MKLFYCNINNFGDKLNEFIFFKCFSKDITYTNLWDANFIGIGSILDNLLLQTKDLLNFYKINPLNIYKPIKVLSAGFGHESRYYQSKTRFFKSLILKRKIEPISLRGKLTKQQLFEISPKLDFSETKLGDLGLLASFLLEGEIIPKRYNLGICPHYADFDNDIFKSILNKNKNSIIIDTRDNPVEFLRQISSCKTIVSTGLHPLIVADSLGIPNIWARISEQTTTRHKYYDYYSNFGIHPEPLNLLSNSISHKEIIDIYNIDKANVEEIKQELFIHHQKKLCTKKYIN